MHARLQTAKAKRMKTLRSSTVEPVLGNLVNYFGMRRVNTRGIKQANKCMLMAAVAYNLKKLLKFNTKKVQADVKAIQQSLQNAFLMFIAVIAFNKGYGFIKMNKRWASVLFFCNSIYPVNR